MSNQGSFEYPVQSSINNQQLAAIMMELSQYAVSAQHIDEMFFWLARMISQHLDVAIVEFWTRQSNRMGNVSLDLRAMACQSDEVPERLVINDAVRMVVEDVQNERRGFWFKSVTDLFSPYQANLLNRYGLGYCSSYLLKSAALLPPQRNDFSAEKIATPLVLGVLLFLERPPSQRLLLGIGHVLERTLTTAKKRGLLLTTDSGELVATSPISVSPQQQQKRQLSLSNLVPKRVQDTHDAKTGNVMLTPAELPNKQIREVYTAIDGQRTVAELVSFTRLNMDEMRASLRILVMRHRVRLYEPDGLQADSAQYLNGR